MASESAILSKGFLVDRLGKPATGLRTRLNHAHELLQTVEQGDLRPGLTTLAAELGHEGMLHHAHRVSCAAGDGHACVTLKLLGVKIADWLLAQVF